MSMHPSRRTLLALGLGVLAAASLTGAPIDTALAHHGWSGYETGKPVRLTGTVRSFTVENPHATMVLEAEGKAWTVILAPPSRMQARGLPAGSLAEGQTVTIEGERSRSEESEIRAERVIQGDKVFEMRA
ncbi:MAG TPA: DUF6152 family protein [Azospirillaceae bacterium]|nr:DUF6152 family protein [Azospirillaceae bacterium]